jgi:DNA-binding transcriptional regulator YdaS (Cro superfamily)
MVAAMDLKTYISSQPRGAAAQLATDIGVHRVLISQWTADESPRQVPAEHCPAIERATKGAVRCEDLRPDIDWAVLRSTKRCKAAPQGVSQ